MKQYWQKGMPHPSTAGYCHKCKSVDFVLATAMEVVVCPNCDPHLCEPQNKKIRAVFSKEHGHWLWTEVFE